jgi:hypothetical protein
MPATPGGRFWRVRGRALTTLHAARRSSRSARVVGSRRPPYLVQNELNSLRPRGDARGPVEIGPGRAHERSPTRRRDARCTSIHKMLPTYIHGVMASSRPRLSGRFGPEKI